MADDADHANDMVLSRIDDELRRRATREREIVGTKDCIDCGVRIPAARRKVRPNAQRCVPCQCEAEM